MKKNSRILSLVLMIIGILLLLPFSKITGFTILKQQSVLISNLLGLIFLFVGVLGLAFQKKMNENLANLKIVNL